RRPPDSDELRPARVGVERPDRPAADRPDDDAHRADRPGPDDHAAGPRLLLADGGLRAGFDDARPAAGESGAGVLVLRSGDSARSCATAVSAVSAKVQPFDCVFTVTACRPGDESRTYRRGPRLPGRGPLRFSARHPAAMNEALLIFVAGRPTVSTPPVVRF